MKANQTDSIEQKAIAQDDGYITKAILAGRLKKTEKTVERWMHDGIIPHVKIGKGRRASVLFNWPDIQAHFKSKFGVGGVR